MAPDMVGTWLPAALADILEAVLSGAGAKPPPRSETWAAWGLRCLARQAEGAEARARDELTRRTLEGIPT